MTIRRSEMTIRTVGLAIMAMALPGVGATPRVKVLPYQTASGATAHKVALGWMPSPDAAQVTGLTYTVLRASGACGASGQVFAALAGASGIAQASYTDQTVLPAATYSYEVVAVAPDGAESAPTNCAEAVIPLAPASGLTATGS